MDADSAAGGRGQRLAVMGFKSTKILVVSLEDEAVLAEARAATMGSTDGGEEKAEMEAAVAQQTALVAAKREWARVKGSMAAAARQRAALEHEKAVVTSLPDGNAKQNASDVLEAQIGKVEQEAVASAAKAADAQAAMVAARWRRRSRSAIPLFACLALL